MTLRQLIEEEGIGKKKIQELEKLLDFKTVENLDIIISNNISEKDLSEYFNSSKFEEDIINVAKGINALIKAYPQHDLKSNNFLLFFMPYLPLKLEAKPLVG